MGYFTDMYKDAVKNFDKAFGKQRDTLRESFAAAGRQAEASAAVQASKGGYLNTPMYNLLLGRNRGIIAGQQAKAMNELAGTEEMQRSALEAQGREAAYKDKLENEKFWMNLIGGAGGALGQALKIFGVPTPDFSEPDLTPPIEAAPTPGATTYITSKPVGPVR